MHYFILDRVIHQTKHLINFQYILSESDDLKDSFLVADMIKQFLSIQDFEEPSQRPEPTPNL
jgi:hypothetical protein